MNTDFNISKSMPKIPGQVAASHQAAPAQAAVAEKAAPAVRAPIKVKLQIDPEQSRKNVQEAIDRLNDVMKKTAQSLNFKMVISPLRNHLQAMNWSGLNGPSGKE